MNKTMEQKQVKLIGLRVLNDGIIQAAELTPDILQKRLVLITGNIGNGKSTLLNAAKIATAGTDAIKKSDAIPPGFLTEALLLDGDIPVYVGVKTGTVSRGENAGKTKLETYLYTKDANGKAVQPIIDGEAATASKYWKALTTELTHNFSDMFTENQTAHRKMIEKLFGPELEKLKLQEVLARIEKAKNARDIARTLCQANGAFMERFKEEGYSEDVLESLNEIDVKNIEAQIVEANIQKDRILHAPEAQYELECEKLNSKRTANLQKIKDEGIELKKKFEEQEREIEEKYLADNRAYIELVESRDAETREFNDVRSMVCQYISYPTNEEVRNEQHQVLVYPGDEHQKAIVQNLDSIFNDRMKKYEDVKPPVRGIVDGDLQAALKKKGEEFRTLQSTPIQYPEKGFADTTEIDQKIKNLTAQKESAESVNSICRRYNLWRNWIEAKGIYEKEIDTLRQLYASIETGVPGMKIIPRETESGRVEVWIMYNGEYNPEYFGNNEKEYRFMFDYSSFQRTIIGLMLQAARLNTKKKALRIAYVDDVAFCKRDIDVLANIAEELDLKLITAWTHEADKEQLMDGQVLVEGGEIFFNKE